jgi:hypothetical protein
VAQPFDFPAISKTAKAGPPATYPFKTDDFARLVDRNGPAKEGGVEMAAEKKKIAK